MIHTLSQKRATDNDFNTLPSDERVCKALFQINHRFIQNSTAKFNTQSRLARGSPAPADGGVLFSSALCYSKSVFNAYNFLLLQGLRGQHGVSGAAPAQTLPQRRGGWTRFAVFWFFFVYLIVL
ncbi:hypothetical protein, partial [Fretibacterium fastidiosum]|uniref:hypothetical protein n=1 Tax=Fretibacterium fastidiosum TaxID=651822 RepID=UPI001AD83E4B